MILFCFTYAGGTTEFFGKLKSLCEPEIRVIPLEYAGHGTRHRESFYSDFFELADDMYQKIRVFLQDGESYSLLGYSMGSISAVEVLRKIQEQGEMCLPTHIFLAAHEPYTKQYLVDYNNGSIDEWVKKRTIEFGAVPEKLIHNKSFWRMYLPIYRADYSIIGKYRFENLLARFDVPATIFYSETDTPYSDMKKWKEYFCDKCDFVEYEGNHFFLTEHIEEIVKVIEKRLVKF